MTLQDTSRVEPADVEDVVVTPASVATECLAEAGGNWEKAARLMRARLDQDAELLRDLMTPLIDQAIWSCIRQACHRVRGSYGSTPADDDSTGLVSMAKREREKWLDYPMSGGLRLRDADRAKLVEEAEMHEANARGNQMKAEFYRLIARRIDGKRVGEVLSEQQVTKIAEKIFGGKGS